MGVDEEHVVVIDDHGRVRADGHVARPASLIDPLHDLLDLEGGPLEVGAGKRSDGFTGRFGRLTCRNHCEPKRCKASHGGSLLGIRVRVCVSAGAPY